MASEIRVPRLGWSMETGTFVRWLKRDGEPVRVGEPLYELEGDKAAQEIESLDAGVLRIAPDGPWPGSDVAVGTLLGCIAAAGETVMWQELQSIVVEASTVGSVEVRVVAPTDSSPSLPLAPSPSLPRSSPRARRVARELGVDWTAVAGSGHRGRVRERDVLRAASEALKANTPPLQTGAQVLPMTPRRRTIAERMAASHRQTAPVTLTTRADATHLVSLREQFKAAGTILPSYTDVLAKLVATTLRDHRILAARWSDAQIALPREDELHIGIAVDTDDGLLVPVLRDVLCASLPQIAAQSRRLIVRARQGQLTAAEMQGSVFTITNLGGYGIDAFTPIINAPESAILGVGAIRRERVVLEDDRIAVRELMTLSLTFDHRVIDGAPAARFLQQLRIAIENPAICLG
jgi:pyruvate dehydrogenase E2 component (dihydrolipoamide acetyltransferase)